MDEKILFPNEVIIETEHFKAAQDWEVPIAGFFILSAKRKMRTIAEFTDSEAQEFISLIRKIRQGMQEALGINEVYLFQNEDTSHNFHFWFFPRYPWMNLLGRKIESVKNIMNYATRVQTIGPIIDHAKAQMNKEEYLHQVHEYVSIMKGYMKDFSVNH